MPEKNLGAPGLSAGPRSTMGPHEIPNSFHNRFTTYCIFFFNKRLLQKVSNLLFAYAFYARTAVRSGSLVVLLSWFRLKLGRIGNNHHSIFKVPKHLLCSRFSGDDNHNECQFELRLPNVSIEQRCMHQSRLF